MSRREPLMSVSSLMTTNRIENPLAALKQIVPSAFTTDARPGVSKRYSHVPTSEIVGHLMQRGWILESAGETSVSRRRESLAPWVAHTITMRHSDFQFGSLRKEDVFPTILFGNSHDTTTPFWMRGGFKRCVCDNQNVITIEEYEAARLRHVGGTVTLMGKIYDVLGKLQDSAGKLGKVIKEWTNLTLTKEQKMDYFAQAANLRAGERISDLTINNLEMFDTRRRPEDKSDDLFTVYQVMQEHATRGFRTVVPISETKVAERSLVRPMFSTRSFVNFNAQLFDLTSNFAKAIKA